MMIQMGMLFLCNFAAACFSIKKIIYIAGRKNLFDEPTELRKIHTHKTPNLGGVAVFVCILLSGCFFYSPSPVYHTNYLIAAAIILFGLGLTDDLLGVDPIKKFLTQLLVACIVAVTTDLHFDQGLMPLLGVPHLPYVLGVALTAFFILFMMNAMNLIDGINGLAGGLALLSAIVFSILFWQLNDIFFLKISLGLCGCLAGFLYFNFSPAKIFMGDTGSLFLGFVLAVFSIRVLESDFPAATDMSGLFLFRSSVGLIYALLIIPIFDTVRIFSVRLLKKQSPFEADRNHIHHILIDLGMTHMRATLLLISVNIFVIALTLIFSGLNSILSLALITIFMGGFFTIVCRIRKQKTAFVSALPGGHFSPGKLRTFSVMGSGRDAVHSKTAAEKLTR